MARTKLALEDQLTIEAFLAFTDTGPGGERWELFEALSKSDTKADQARRRKVYASVATCQHYVTVSLKTVEVDAYDRESGWRKRTVSDLGDALDLPALGLSIPQREIYRDAPLAPQ
jgi:hypothetical protein